MVYSEYLLPFWESESWVRAQQGLSTWPAHSKNPGCWVSNELPWLAMFCTCCHNPGLEELSVCCATPLWEDPWKIVPGSPLDFTPCNFSLCWLISVSFYWKKSQLCIPSYAETESLSGKSLSLGWSEDLQHTYIHDLDHEQSSSLMSLSRHHLP